MKESHINAEKMPVYDTQDLREWLREKFPEGLVIESPPLSLETLKQMEWSKITGDNDKLDQSVLWGMAGEGVHPLEQSGTGELKAELFVTPDKYHLLRPDDSYTYQFPELADEDWQLAAPTSFVRIHATDNAHMTFEMDVTPESLRCLRIEGRPFEQVMKTVRDVQPKNDTELKQILLMQNIHENGMGEKPLPDSIRPLVEKFLPEDMAVVDNPDYPTFQHYLMAIEKHLHWTNALKRDGAVNFSAVYDPSDGGRAAREVVDAVNRIASQVPGEPFAMATRQGNHVTVSCHHSAERLMKEVELTVRTHPALIAFAKQPFSPQQEPEYLILSTGQVVMGYANLENLHRGYEYTLKQSGADGAMKWAQLIGEPGKAYMQNLFTSRQQVDFPESYGGQITVHRRLSRQQYVDAGRILNLRFDHGHNHDGGVTIQGETSRYRLAELTLNSDDTRIYHILRQPEGKIPSYNHQLEVFKRAVATEYYAAVIKEERDRIEAVNAGYAAERAQKKAILDRIEGAELYGKVNDLHIRAVIDGKMQDGRRLVDNMSIRALMSAAVKSPGRNHGKEYLYYPDYFSDENLKEAAADIYRDVLGLQNQQITDVKGRIGKDGNLYISCKVDGQKQLSKRISELDMYKCSINVKDGLPEQWILERLAGKYYNGAVKLSEMQKQDGGMKI